MNTNLKILQTTAIAAVLATTALTGVANAASPDGAVKLLTANFDARQVVQVEVGDFHFKPGQVAPIHTHTAPAVGYVAKGSIIYQIEGEKPRVLRAGDAFYEPTGKRILRFDNASATKEAVFLDFNLEQAGEPFIVFEKKPTEAIDRRSLPTVDLGNRRVDKVNIFTNDLDKSQTLSLATPEPILGLVAEGIIELRIEGKPNQRIAAGGSFALPTPETQATIVNASSEVPAKVITFHLK
ncbi:MAG: cupin domain-containing protein [Proteobacteria bacterium]|nr:cupin domain-containing protein [Pseudomonadota bacterium]